ncbi:MAG: DNA polymerase III subunit alpha [Candidatus Doudnabacteria bacterium]|nr:DNA polymerase III subunit alpha [Candidatus Doudnabacteria bacterium]
MANFVHLHLHTEYSLLDGVSKIPKLVEKIKTLEMNACAITDHGVMFGTYDFWSKCRAEGIKPIIGCEVYVANRSRKDKDPGIDNERYHLTLLAKTKEGYHNLIKMVSEAHTEGFYYKPRTDRESLEKYGKGIIALSGCLASNFNRYLVQNKRTEAVEWLQFLGDCFDEVYVELQRNGIKESEDLIATQVAIAKELGLGIVATGDVHYIEKEDYKIQEIAWCISDGKKITDSDRRQYGSTEFYVKSPAQMAELFADLPEAVENTQKIADSIEEYSLEFDRIQPKFDKKLDVDATREKMREETYAGAKIRYGEITPDIKQRIDYELSIINEKGYNDYFLVVQDYIRWAKEQGIIVGPGRGSGAGSVVAYALGITNLDPIRWDLIFERFLNPERPSPPDFDIDFQDDRRDELFQYVTKKYGADSTSYVGTFGRLKTRAAIRDIARVMGIDLQLADKLSKMVLTKFGKVYKLKQMRKEVPEFDELLKSDPILEELAGYVDQMDELARHVSIHASAYLITPQPVTDYTPVQLETKGGEKIITQLEGPALESLGLMKFDFLGLANLTIIKNTLIQIKYQHGKDIDIDNIPLDDEKTFQLFREANTTAVFQFESEGMKKYLRELQPTEIEDLIFMNAAYRPGAMNYIHDYILRKNGKQPVSYPHPDLESVLKSTYGFAIYQEQVMNIAVDFAGYSLGEADMLRRAMGKKKPEVMAKEKEKFAQKAIAKGYTAEDAAKVFSYMEPFADYGFNRSHSAAYAMIAYQTAYLKSNYPLEFTAGLMQTDLGSSDKLQRDLIEAKNMHIQILPPSVNHSFYSFSIEGSAIRFGLGGIKTGGEKTMKAIVDERIANGKYAHLDDLIERVSVEHLTKKDLECLIQAGAMDEFGPRNALLAIMPGIYDRLNKQAKGPTNQIGLFATLMDTADSQTARITSAATPLPQLDPLSEEQKLQWEKELIGVFLSNHPLDAYEWAVNTDGFISLDKLSTMNDGAKVKALAVIDNSKQIRSKRDGKPMAFLTISDKYGSAEAVVFNSVFTEVANLLSTTAPVVIFGKVSQRNEEPSIVVDSIAPAEEIAQQMNITLDIRNVTDKDALARLKGCFSEDGSVTVTVIYGSQKEPKKLNRKMHSDPQCMEVIKEFLKNNG